MANTLDQTSELVASTFTPDIERLSPFIAARAAAERELATDGCPPWIAKPCKAIQDAVRELEKTCLTTAD